MLGAYVDGLLLGDGKSIELIGSHVSPEWKYELGEAVNMCSIQGNDTIILMTNDTITAIYKPQLSSTVMEMIELVGGDLLVVLLGSMWLLDRRFHQNEKRL